MSSVEASAPMNRRPDREHVQTMTTVRSHGFLQRVRVYGREPGGLVISKQVTFRTDGLQSRGAIVQKAVDLIAGHGGRFPQAPDSTPIDVIGGVYQGTYEAIPEG